MNIAIVYDVILPVAKHLPNEQFCGRITNNTSVTLIGEEI